MTTQAAAGGFIAQCPDCPWHVYSSDRSVADGLLGAHRCQEVADG